MTRYVIIGAGAIGAAVAAQLHLSGAETVLIARGKHAQVIHTQGMRYLRPEGEQRVRVPVAESAAAVDLTPDDVLIVATKSQDTESVLQEWSWRPVAGGLAAAETLPLISLQNGIDNERAALRRFARVSGAAIWMPGSYLNPGEIVAPGEPQAGVFWLGRYPDRLDPDAEKWATDLRKAKFGIQLVEDLPRWKAGKLVGNVVNAIDALYGREGVDEVVEAVQAEARKVLTAAGYDPADLEADSAIDLSGHGLAKSLLPLYAGSSTRQSLARATGSAEADFLNGEISLLGRVHGIPTPLNTALQAMLNKAVVNGVPAGGGDRAELDALLAGNR
jgi:2-dehydropantoate 2-reductase